MPPKRGRSKKARHGDVDILVGTHALLTKHLQFAALGLLIVDEEQRFGGAMSTCAPCVMGLMYSPLRHAHPRTSFSMLGCGTFQFSPKLLQGASPYKPASAIGTGLLRQAIERELDRGGQILLSIIASRILIASPSALAAGAGL